jgi:transmembrane sensor
MMLGQNEEYPSRTGRGSQAMTASADQIKEEGAHWVSRLLSGEATDADADAIARWRSTSKAHEAAFGDAVRLLRAVEGAAVARDQRASSQVTALPRRRPTAALGRPAGDRRWFLGGAIAASAAVAILARENLAPKADFRTGKGQRRQVTVSPGLNVDMNTETSLSVTDGPLGKRIALLGGQAVVSSQPPSKAIEVMAGAGVTSAQQARFDVRDNGSAGVCVTCLEGEVQVRHASNVVRLGANEQVTYGQHGVGKTIAVDSNLISAWQAGMLIFHNQPLSEVIAEVNRYRAGHIVIADQALAGRPVDAVFYLDQMSTVVAQVQQLSGAHATHLPGGLVLLS